MPKALSAESGKDAIAAITYALEKVGIMTVRHSAPPSAMMFAQDTTEHNMGVVQNFFRLNWSFLMKEDHWGGATGTLPFWDDRTLRKNYKFTVSTESPNKFSLCWNSAMSDAQMQAFGGKDSVWCTARFEYFIAFQLQEQEHTGSGEVLSVCCAIVCSIVS